MKRSSILIQKIANDTDLPFTTVTKIIEASIEQEGGERNLGPEQYRSGKAAGLRWALELAGANYATVARAWDALYEEGK